VTYAINSTGLQSVDLTTRAIVKALVDGSVDTTDQDALIDQMISEVSAEMTRYLGFHTLRGSRTEQYSVPSNRKMFTFDSRPVVNLSSIKYAGTIADLATADEMESKDYVLHKQAGWIQLCTGLTYSNGFFGVTYDAGFGLTAGDIVANYPEISGACARQVKYYLQRTDGLGGSVSSIPGASASYSSEYGLLQSVKSTLDAYRRSTM
jgi:hypothetical protein